MHCPIQVELGLGTPDLEDGDVLREAWGSSYRAEDGSQGWKIGKSQVARVACFKIVMHKVVLVLLKMYIKSGLISISFGSNMAACCAAFFEMF